MNDPKKYLEKYLLKLINSYLHIKLYKKQLDILDEWKGPHKIDTLTRGATFFKLVMTSFNRIMLIELCLFVSKKEQINIFDWLNKANQHSKSLEPTRSNKNKGLGETRIKIKDKDYKEVIENHIFSLSKHQTVIKNLIACREKIFTHYDKKYFNNPEAVYKKYSINVSDLDDLINTIEDILHEQHSYLFKSSMINLTPSSYSNVNMILLYTRAFMRVRSDKKLIIEKNFKPVVYLKENYPYD